MELHYLVLAILLAAIPDLSLGLVEEDTTADPTDPSGCAGNDWVTFKDEKCLKLIKTFASRAQAEQLCIDETIIGESAPSLVTPKYEAEQEFITQYVFNRSEVENNVWIGASKVAGTNETFIWTDDESEFRYTNWAVDYPSGVNGRDCVQMQSSIAKARLQGLTEEMFFDPAIDGKWRDVGCNAGNFVVCQKYQIWSSADVQRGILNNRRDIEELREIIKNNGKIPTHYY